MRFPQEKLRQLEQELKTIPENQQAEQRRARIEQWLDSGLGSCVLQNPAIAKIVQEALLYHAGERYRLLAWCVMPNHVHVLVSVVRPLDKIVQTWKSFTAHRVKALAAPGMPFPFWQRDYWDRYMRDDRHLLATLDYIHNNPVKAGLCTTARDWQWSSARLAEATPPGATASPPS
ncbi:hypothetical protein FACS1894154_11390 [Betaproteobacteria bacterium]|nr:hypothetical protein FACS1894154_11390 [Betaproteobacteria bacterium]